MSSHSPTLTDSGLLPQAAAANKQGTLDNFFDVSLGSGTYAPRRRQAYSSKRLQQVVTDFRTMHSSTKSKSVASGSEEDGPSEKGSVPKKRRKGKQVEKKPRKTTVGERGRGGRVPRGRKRNDKESFEPEKEQGEADAAPGSAAPPVLASKLRPRPKPNNQSIAGEAGEAGEAGGDEEEVSDSEDDFVIKRRKV